MHETVHHARPNQRHAIPAKEAQERRP